MFDKELKVIEAALMKASGDVLPLVYLQQIKNAFREPSCDGAWMVVYPPVEEVYGDDEDRPLSDGGLIITCAGVPIAVAIEDERQHANALLISAAPYLLEALEGILSDDSPLVSLREQQERWPDRMESARLAVERARMIKAQL